MRFVYSCVALFISSHIYADSNCLNPFEGRSNNFILQETLSCGSQKTPVNLYIKSSNESAYTVPNSSSYFLQAQCVENYKVMNLFYNTTYVDWSDKIADDENVFKINLACKTDTLAILNFNVDTVDVTLGHIKVSTRIYNDDAVQTLQAYVMQSEDQDNQITVRMYDGSVGMTANKKMIDQNSICYANWEVNNYKLDPNVASYILGWKDNWNYNCVPQVKGMSTGDAFLLAAGIVTIPLTVVGALLYWHRAKVRDIGNRVKDSFNQ